MCENLIINILKYNQMGIFKGMLELVKGDNQNIYNSILAKKRLKKYEYGYIKVRNDITIAYWALEGSRFCLVFEGNYPFCFDRNEFMSLAKEGQEYLEKIYDDTWDLYRKPNATNKQYKELEAEKDESYISYIKKMEVMVPYYIDDMGDIKCDELKFIVDTFLSQNSDFRQKVDDIKKANKFNNKNS